MSPIRPVKSPITTRKHVVASVDVLPPWKQGDYMAEASYASMTSMTSMTSSTVTELGQEQRWEQQVTGVKEVRRGPLRDRGSKLSSGGQQVQRAI